MRTVLIQLRSDHAQIFEAVTQRQHTSVIPGNLKPADTDLLCYTTAVSLSTRPLSVTTKLRIMLSVWFSSGPAAKQQQINLQRSHISISALHCIHATF